MSIDCERCGNCCPTTCDFLAIDNDNPRKTSCKVHDDMEKKGLICSLSPMRLFLSGIACKALLSAMELENIEIRTLANGQKAYK